MSNQINTFTSTGQKVLRHGSILSLWNIGIPVPMSLQVAPTEYCSLRCKFCSVANRSKKHVLPLGDLIAATERFIQLGTKTVEITGGGDPMCYPKLSAYVRYLVTSKMKIGIITNSLGINRCLDKDLLEYVSWIRISANVYDYKNTIEIPTERFNGTLGFSYVWTEGLSTIERLKEIKQIALDNNVSYIRLVPNCLASNEEQKKNNDFLTGIAEQVGAPVFFQRKEFDTPPQCFWGYLKPFLYSDGYVDPCSSTVLNPDADKQFNPSYRWCHWSEIEKVWQVENVKSAVDTTRCEHCVFAEQNRMLEYALSKQQHEDFI